MKKMKSYKDIDSYIASFPPSTQKILKKLRREVRSVAPEAGEAIKYGLATLTLHGNLIHFGAYEHHIGFYPNPEPIKAFAKELSKYKTSKGAIQFPIDRPLPYPLIKKIVKWRVKQVRTKLSRSIDK